MACIREVHGSNFGQSIDWTGWLFNDAVSNKAIQRDFIMVKIIDLKWFIDSYCV